MRKVEATMPKRGHLCKSVCAMRMQNGCHDDPRHNGDDVIARGARADCRHAADDSDAIGATRKKCVPRRGAAYLDGTYKLTHTVTDSTGSLARSPPFPSSYKRSDKGSDVKTWFAVFVPTE